MENRSEKWEELEKKADEMLEDPARLPERYKPKHFYPILRLWIDPVFTGKKVWVFYSPEMQLNPLPNPIIREIIWDKESDMERFTDPSQEFDPDPRFKIRQCEIGREELNRLLGRLSSISFPAFIEDFGMGRDGEFFGIETYGIANKAKISWWSEYPEEWREAVDWYDKAMGKIESCLAKTEVVNHQDTLRKHKGKNEV